MSSHIETLKRVLDGNYEGASEAEKTRCWITNSHSFVEMEWMFQYIKCQILP